MANNSREWKECPECGKSLVGDEIPEAYRSNYGNHTHYSLLIGIEDPKKYDGISWWMCPYCKQLWDRFTGEKVDKSIIGAPNGE